MPIIIITILILIGGTSFASSKASPEGILYPMKVNIVEKVEKAFSIGIEAKVETEVDFALRRLEELEKLVTQSRFKNKTKDMLLVNFRKHVDEEIILAESLNKKDGPAKAISLNEDFESRLVVHTLIFESIDAPEDIIPFINIEIEKLKLQRIVLENAGKESEPQTLESASLKEKLAIEKIGEIREQIKNSGQALKDEVETALKRAEDLVAQGKKMLEIKDFEEAASLFQKSIDLTQDLKTILNVGGDSGVPVLEK